MVFISTPKEPHYFALDLPAYRYVSDWPGYLRLFDHAEQSQPARGEGSVFYLYSERAARHIRECIPDARLIVMLRNPLDLAVSMHAQALLTGDENIPAFEQAWALCGERRRGVYKPPGCRDVKVLLYDELPLLGRQLQRLLSAFPEQQVGWWFYEDFAASTGEVYRQVLEFLGVPDDGRCEFPRVNERKRARSRWLTRFTRKTPEPLVNVAMRLKGPLGLQRWGILDGLRSLNEVPAKPVTIPAGLAARMRDHFESDVELLQQITGRDLSNWLESSG